MEQNPRSQGVKAILSYTLASLGYLRCGLNNSFAGCCATNLRPSIQVIGAGMSSWPAWTTELLSQT